MKYIFTIASGIYHTHFENFKNSINNFYPNDNKKLIVFSDQLKEYNNLIIGNTCIEIISIPSFVYTSILLNKFNFIIWYCKENNIDLNELIYYFDIDTWFYDNAEIGLQYLDNYINEYNTVIYSSHPINIINKLYGYEYYIHGHIYNKNDNGIQSDIFNDYLFYKNDLLNKDCIASFFAGTLENIIKLNNKYNEIYYSILKNDRVIPNYCDEDIVNYIWLKQLLNEYTDKYVYVIDKNLINISNLELYNNKNYIVFNDKFKISSDYSKYLICCQKYNTDKKIKLR
jgi:hypothetical protein